MSDLLKCPVCGRDDFKAVKGYKTHVKLCGSKVIKSVTKEKSPDIVNYIPDEDLDETRFIPIDICPKEIGLFPDRRLMHLVVSGKKMGDMFYIEQVKMMK